MPKCGAPKQDTNKFNENTDKWAPTDKNIFVYGKDKPLIERTTCCTFNLKYSTEDMNWHLIAEETQMILKHEKDVLP